jgi:hypothetical protein
MSKWSEHVRGAALSVGSAAVLFLLLTALPAFAASRHSGGKRESQEKAARKACLSGDYATGVSMLTDLFVDYQDPIYVFNQGRCLEQNSRCKDAIMRFEEFLHIGETAKLEPADRAAAKSHIDECKVKLADEEKALALTPQPLPQPLPQPVTQPDATTETTSRPKVEPEPTKSGKGLLIGGIVIGGVGVAATVAGIVFNLKANGMADEMENTVDAYTESKSSSQKTYGTLAWVGYGVGAACIATGAVLIGIGASRGGSSGQADVALVPAVGPGHAGVLLRGGF